MDQIDHFFAGVRSEYYVQTPWSRIQVPERMLKHRVDRKLAIALAIPLAIAP